MEPIAIGMVGLRFGRHIVEELQKEENRKLFRIAAVCDLDAEKAQAIGAELGVPALTQLDELLGRKDIPTIGLFTGPVGRAELVRSIIRAGKDVMTTKPFELSSRAALEVLNEAKALKRVVHLNSPAPVLPPDLALIRDWRKTYDLGRPVGVRADVWVSYREKPDGSWYDDPQRCPAPPIFRLGIYLINDLITIFGEPERVHVLESRLFTGRPTSDHAQLGIRFTDGALANIFASFCVNDGDYYRNSLVLNFENGTVYRNVGPQRSSSACELSLIQRVDDKRTCVDRAELAGTSGQYQWDTFHRAVRGDGPAEDISPEQIAAGVRIIELMREALDAQAAV